MQEIIGLIGAICFAISSWPQAYLCVKTKSAKGITWGFILLWLSGAIFCTIYVIARDKYVLLPNYVCGGLGMFVTLLIKIRENLKRR